MINMLLDGLSREKTQQYSEYKTIKTGMLHHLQFASPKFVFYFILFFL